MSPTAVPQYLDIYMYPINELYLIEHLLVNVDSLFGVE